VNSANTGEQVAPAETQPVRGPGGAMAVLKVSSTDDHSKNSHECSAEYQLLFKPPSASAPLVVDLLITDAEYGRNLMLQLEGFSQDGKHVFGIFSEDGKYANSSLFDYDTTARQVQIIDLTKLFFGSQQCRTTFSVMGTSENGVIAVELNSVNGCVRKRLFLLNPVSRMVQNPSRTTAILGLYKPESPTGAQ
jgi:hypothetical protein